MGIIFLNCSYSRPPLPPGTDLCRSCRQPPKNRVFSRSSRGAGCFCFIHADDDDALCCSLMPCVCVLNAFPFCPIQVQGSFDLNDLKSLERLAFGIRCVCVCVNVNSTFCTKMCPFHDFSGQSKRMGRLRLREKDLTQK
jgi:hypothetical protein